MESKAAVSGAIGACAPIDSAEEPQAVPSQPSDAKFLNRVLDSVFAFVGLLSPEGILLQANEAALSSIPLHPDELLGKPFQNAWWWSHDPSTCEQIEEAIHRAAAGESITADIPTRVGQDRYIITEFALKPITDAQGAITHLVFSGIDVTGHRNSEREIQRLLHNEQQARATAEMLNRVGPILLGHSDFDKLVNAVTDLATSLTGAQVGAFFYNVPDAAGDAFVLYSLSGVSRDQFTGFPMPLEGPVFAGPDPIRFDDMRRQSRYTQAAPTSQPAAISYLAVPVISRSGESLGGLYFTHEQPAAFTVQHEHLVTGISALAAIAVENARLIEMLRRERLTAEQSQAALKASNDELQQFAYVASHDLQEPLRTIAGFSQLLAKRYYGKLDAEGEEFIGYVVQGAQRMSELIQDLLEYSRLMHSEAARRVPVDMQWVLSSILANLNQSIAESNAVITSEPLPTVLGEHVPLLHLVQNLLSNSIKYRGANPPRIHISSQTNESDWTFCVADEGIGIDPQYHQRIFGLFKRLHGKDVPGTGIGLAIARRIVERHGGVISVESSPNAGAKFFFTIARNAAPGESVQS